MKNIYLVTKSILFISTILCSTTLHSQEAVVGMVKNGEPVLTSLTDATTVLKGGLEASVSVTDIYIDLETQSGKYFLIGSIRNGKISGKAVELHLDGGILRAVGGPGIEITCSGLNCLECAPMNQNGKMICRCNDNPQQPNAQCVTVTRTTITIW